LSQLWSYLPSDSPRKFQWVESLPSKRRILEREREREEQGLKRKIGETSVEKLHNNNHAFYSRASWGRVKMKPHEQKKTGTKQERKEGENKEW
jgi:hypothetical protein